MNFKDPAKLLFFEYVRILNEIMAYNPDVKFLLENVRMRAEYENVISSHLGLRPVAINSSLVSAQNLLPALLDEHTYLVNSTSLWRNCTDGCSPARKT